MMEKREEKYDLCKAFVDMKLEGIMEGKEEGRKEGRREYLIQTVCIKLRKNKPATVIAEELEEDISEIEKVITAQKKVGSYDGGADQSGDDGTVSTEVFSGRPPCLCTKKEIIYGHFLICHLEFLIMYGWRRVGKNAISSGICPS